MGFQLGGHPKQNRQIGPTGPAVGSFKLGRSHLSLKAAPGAAVSASPKKSGGGLLHTIGHVVKQTGADLKDAAYNAPGGVVALGKAIVHDEIQGLSGKGIGNQTTDMLINQGKQTVQDFKHPLRHPGNTLLDTVGVLSAGAGTAARGAAATRAFREGEGVAAAAKAVARQPKPGPRVLRVNDLEVRGHYSKSALSRGVQKTADAALQKGAEKNVRIENLRNRRAAKWNDRNQRVADATARAAGTRLQVLGKKLSPDEQRALRLVAEEVPVHRRLAAQEARAAQAKTAKETARHQERIALTKAAMQHLTEDANGKPAFKPEATKLKGVYSALERAASDRAGILKQLDLMDEAAQQAAKVKAARLAAGDGTDEARAAAEAQAELIGRNAAFDLQRVRASERRANREAESASNVRAAVSRLADRAPALHDRLAIENEKLARMMRGEFATNDLPSFGRQINRESLLARQHDAVAALSRQYDRAVAASGKRAKATDRGIAAAEKQAAATAERKAIEGATARRQAEVLTNADAGLADVSPDAPFIGNPVERSKISGKPKVSSTGTFGHTRKPSSLKTSTGASVEHAMERNDVTNIVAERHREAVRLGKVERLRSTIIKAGETQPRRADDVWVWADKTVSNGKIPPEVRRYLDNPEALAAKSDRERAGILSKIKEATFERHDWNADPEARAEFEKLAAEGKGVFVPRRLMGELGKREYNVGHVPVLDEINNAQKAALIYLKASYPIAQAISNTGMNLIQQGFAAPARLTQAVKLAHKIGPDGAAVVDDIMGGGAVLQAGFEGQGRIARGTQALAHYTSGWVDTPARRAAFLHEAIKAGYGTPEKWKRLISDPAKAQDLAEVAQRAKEAIVDYGELSPVERNLIRRLVFVYPWQKGATKYAGHFLRDHPVQAAALGQAGALGKQQADQAFGPLPTYLQGAIPVGGGLVNPTSINQFQTPAQVAEAVAGLLSGNPATQSMGQGFLSPAPALAVALLTGRDDLGFKLKGNALQKLRDTQVAPAPAAALARALAPNSRAVQIVAGSRGASKSFPNPNDAIYRFGLGGLYPRKYNRAALNQNAARQKSGN